MLERLPDIIKVQNLAETGRILEGKLSLASMQRLDLQLAEGADNANEAEVTLEFGIDVQGIKFLSGHIVAPVKMACQRCMGAMDYTVDISIKLAMIKSEEEAEELPDRYEPLLVNEPELSLVELIEEELMLALPIVALHENDDCPAATVDNDLQGTQPIETEGKPNPFVVLAQLKNK